MIPAAVIVAVLLLAGLTDAAHHFHSSQWAIHNFQQLLLNKTQLKAPSGQGIAGYSQAGENKDLTLPLQEANASLVILAFFKYIFLMW